ncbi:hypothetical protein LTR48_002882 [Friedmanniomyces endolithicus]|uniref:C2H2-type domain-containing protein n=1 Tax=Rachicladosporium monterosium TaxID=1507873 RepID=A0ABR0L9L3_9PEZI|nr:hypothetical protein LTR48_002882 [Friedmanniomyces endolithicus]KAK5145580.1 hypothetical protein LTR32_002689 [Rachicladosporium monterosium]
MTFDCNECDRAFDTDGALQQHLRDSPANVVTFDCNECDRAFDTDGALQQHLQDSPVHTKQGTRSDIYKIWGGQPNLMNSYGLKPYNLRDLEEADAIVDSLTQQMGRVKFEWRYRSLGIFVLAAGFKTADSTCKYGLDDDNYNTSSFRMVKPWSASLDAGILQTLIELTLAPHLAIFLVP